MERRFELRQGDSVLGILTQSANSDVTLKHDLTEARLQINQTVDAYDESGERLYLKTRVIRREVDVAFFNEQGAERLGIAKNDGGFLDVSDPKQLAWLRAKLTGRGTVMDETPIRDGVLKLEITPFDPKVRAFRERVEQLYAAAKEWLSQSRLATSDGSITLKEGIYGPYYVPLLVIHDAEGRRFATLEPAGSSIIAASGRVDIVGRYDKQSVLYLCAGNGHEVFKNVTSAGWYWIEDARLGRARQLDGTLFRDLLKAVTDLNEL